jgi:uracil-DNA glycosylase family 4
MLPPSSNKPVRTQSGLTRDAACRMCRLHETADFVCLLGQGPTPAKAMIVGEAPGAREDDSGRPFVGRSGQLLEELMGEVGIEREDVYITNAVHCRPPDNRTPTKTEVRKCKSWLDYEIETVKPKVVLLLGGTALESALGIKGIKKARGQPIEKGDITYLPTYHPSYVLRDDRHRSTLRADLRKFRAMVDGGGLPTVKGLDYRIVHSRLDIEEMLDDIEANDLLVYDLETTALSPWHGNIVSIGFGTATKQWIVLVNHPAWSLPIHTVENILERIDGMDIAPASFPALYNARQRGSGGYGKFKSNHNIKFDALWLKVHFGLDWYGDFDTMLADYILDENKLHGLDHCASERYGAVDWDVPLSLKQGKTGTIEEHARYLALDLLYTYQLTIDMMDDLEEEPGIERVFYRLLMPASKLFIQVEFDGVYVDSDKFDETEKYLRSQIAASELELNKLFPGVNWASPKQVGDILFNQLKLPITVETKTGAPSAGESALKQIASMHPIPNLLLKRREAAQQLSFFIEGWKPWLKRHRLHPSFKLHGTVTGRLSCENPNLQQVPRDPRIRSLITAPPGWELVEADLSQIELRILAELSRDPEMLRCFTTGVDIHWLTCLREIYRGGGYKDEMITTAIALTRRNRVDYDEAYEILLKEGPDAAIKHGPPKSDDFPGWKEVRKRAKAINFGYAYGMWWKKFVIYAFDNYDVVVTPEQAQASRVAYFDLYRRLPTYHTRQRSFAGRHGYVRSMFGRKRRLPRAMDRDDSYEKGEAERQAINSPVQSFASDLNLAAAIELSNKHPRSYFRIAGTVHDSILMYVRKDKVRDVVPDILKVMSHPALIDEFEIELNVPIEADVKIGPWSLGVSPEEYGL